MKRFLMVVLSCLFFLDIGLFAAEAKRTRVTKKMEKAAEKRATTLRIPSRYVKVTVSLEKSPVYSTNNSMKTRISNGSSGPGTRQWLKTDIQFSFLVPEDYFRKQRSRFSTVDKLRIEVYLRVPAPKTKRENAVWFYGSQVLHSVLLDGNLKKQVFSASLFMPPFYVEQYLPREERSGSENSKGKFSAKEAEGVVLFYNKENVRLGYTVFSQSKHLSSREENLLLQRAMEFRKHSSSNVIMLWPREKTPWQWLECDRYELSLTDFSEDAAPLRKDKNSETSTSSKEKDSGDEEESGDTEE